MTSIPNSKPRVFMNSSTTRNGKQQCNFTSATSILVVIKLCRIKKEKKLGVGVKKIVCYHEQIMIYYRTITIKLVSQALKYKSNK